MVASYFSGYGTSSTSSNGYGYGARPVQQTKSEGVGGGLSNLGNTCFMNSVLQARRLSRACLPDGLHVLPLRHATEVPKNTPTSVLRSSQPALPHCSQLSDAPVAILRAVPGPHAAVQRVLAETISRTQVHAEEEQVLQRLRVGGAGGEHIPEAACAVGAK